ncbi:hypothetical protein AAG570_001093 [Ranatra chinensis]|uniref:Uncharacterized protein n=1 Tax=Ranatra chinensis TaxID=642074 RepID=A0ABD0YML2_9HEMI
MLKDSGCGSNDIDLEARLSTYDCLYTWDLEAFKTGTQRKSDIISVITEKEEEISDDLFRSFALRLILSYECSVRAQWSSSWEHLRECEIALKNAPSGQILNRFAQSLNSVLEASKAFLALRSSTGGINQVQKVGYFI